MKTEKPLEWKSGRYKLILVRAKYTNGMYYFGFETKNGEAWCDVSCNTPENRPGTITINHNFSDLCGDLCSKFVERYCTKKVGSVQSGFVTMPMYELDMDKILSESVER